MTTKQWDQSVTDSIKNMVTHNTPQGNDDWIEIAGSLQGEPTSFSAWLEQNGDSIECCENCTEIDQRIANHDIYKNGNPFQ
jgi:hypothetical protein